MLWQSLLTGTALVTGVLSISTSHVQHEKRSASPISKRQRLDSDAIVPVRIGLRQSNLHTGYDRLMDVSHPESPNYGKHLSKEEVHDLFAPAEESVEIVKSWLLSTGLFDEKDVIQYENKGWLAVDILAKHAESLLGTEYYEYETSSGTRIGCDDYYLPIHVSSHVDYIKPGVTLSAPLKKRQIEKRGGSPARGSRWHAHGKPPHYPGWSTPPGAGKLPADLQNCGVNITPTCIKAVS